MRDIEPSIVTDHADRMTYSGYLDLAKILDAQHPLPRMQGHGPAPPDPMLFLILHQPLPLRARDHSERILEQHRAAGNPRGMP